MLTVLLVITQTHWSFFYLGLIGTLTTFVLASPPVHQRAIP